MKNGVNHKIVLDRTVFRDVGFLYIASCFVLVQLFEYGLVDAAIFSPAIIFLLISSIYMVIQAAWIIVHCVDKIAQLFQAKG